MLYPVVPRLYLLLLVQLSLFTLCTADCNNNLLVDNNTLYALSDNRTDARNAGEICQASGGFLAQITSWKENQKLFWRMEGVYTQFQELENTSVYINPDDEFLYKYRPSEETLFEDTIDISSWNRPSDGEISSFKLFKSETRNFTEGILFCYVEERDLINSVCPGGWDSNFKIYGGYANTSNTIKLYQYRPEEGNPGTSRLLLSSNQTLEGFEQVQASNAYPVIYLPDISVFVGARSDVDEEDWVLNDGSVVNSYPAGNRSICQQMSWPLTYVDGINLLPKQCVNEEAYFVCQYTNIITAKVESVPCNGSILQLSWNASKLHNVTSSIPAMKYQIQVRGMGFDLSTTLDATDKPNYEISNLHSRTEYNISIKLKSVGCEIVYASTTVQGKTTYGIPPPVTSANVKNKTSLSDECVVEWSHKDANFAFLSYVITARSFNKTTTTNVSLKSENLQRNDTNFSSEIDLSAHGYSSNVTFTILVRSCEGESASTNVTGTCLTSPAPMSLVTTATPASGSIPVAALVGGLLALVLVIFILVGVILYKRRRKENSNSNRSSSTNAIVESPNDQDDNITEAVDARYQVTQTQEDQTGTLPIGNGVTTSTLYENASMLMKTNELTAAILKDDLEKTYSKECRTGFTSLHTQFKNLAKYANGNEGKHTVASNPANKKLNRYKNIYPYDHACVNLPGNRYINASYIEGYKNRRRYIATQGPKHNTIADFWEMIWKENSSIIVMLCNCVEKEKIKCEMYWPDSALTAQHGNIKIIKESEVLLGDFLKRIFEVQDVVTQERRKVVQFHFTSWPDHDVPETSSGMFYLRQHVNGEAEADPSNGPIVVHCSAGAGRTGAYIAVDNAIEEIHAEEKVDVVQIVLKMRNNRKDMVQNENQFVFVYKLLVEEGIVPKTSFTPKSFTKFTRNPNWEATASREFKLLSSLVVITPAEVFEVPSEESVYQNARSAAQYFANQVKFYSASADQVLRMDAFHVTNGYYSGNFIASSGPRSGEENNFWEMVVRNNSCIVVSLEDQENDSLASAEPRVGDVIKYETITIHIDDVSNNEFSRVRKLTVSSKEASNRSLEVTYVHVRFLPSSITTPTVQNLIEVIERIKMSLKVNQLSTAVIYCRYGCTRTGFVLCLANIAESLKHENKIDVFRTVKDLRDTRPGILETLEMYKQCYQLVDGYMQALS